MARSPPPRPHWTHLMVLLGTAGMALISQRNIVSSDSSRSPDCAGPEWVPEETDWLERFRGQLRRGGAERHHLALGHGAIALLLRSPLRAGESSAGR